MVIPRQKHWYPLLLAIVLVAFLSTFFTIFFPYIREEGRYTIASIEMLYNHYYWRPTTFGEYYRRPPLYNWLTLPIMHWIGVKNVLVATRIVTACGTVLLAMMQWFFSFRLFKNKLFAIFSVAVLFSGNFLLGRTWVAYPDTWFAFFIFTAISCMWLSVKEQRPLYWLPVPFVLFAAFLTKALSCYIFYGTALLVIGLSTEHRHYLFKPASILTHVLTIILPIIWLMLPETTKLGGMIGDMSGEVDGGFLHFEGLEYLKKIMLTPFTFLSFLLPVVIVAFYCLYRQKKYATILPVSPLDVKPIKQLLWIIVLSVLPYWFFPVQNLEARYMLPFTPMIAIVLAYCIWCAGEKMVGFTIIILILGLVIKCVFSIFMSLEVNMPVSLFGDQIAYDVVQRIQRYDNLLYTDNFVVGGYGVNIASKIDTIRWPKAPIVAVPTPFSKGCVITKVKNATWSKYLLQIYDNGKGQPIFLYCKK